MSTQERLQKILAHAGVASRRACEELIRQGRISVNGQTVTEVGVKADPQRDVIAVDGQPLGKRVGKQVYIILNKPRHVLSAASDEQRGRKTVLDLVDSPERIYPVGRLDLLSEGLILLTNDGDLTQKLTHPRYQIEKEYHVLVGGHPATQTLLRWRQGGLEVEGKPVGAAIVEILNLEGEDTWLKVILTEGRKREIRAVAQALGHPVKKLIRVRLGPLKLGHLKPGQWRHLNPREVERLKKATTR
ncbi:MAG: rRNA pseudouridine synthase [Anaerolineae bacterium]|nr:rRNA pseudouridine synthase [Anaerolineae bacterium]